MVLRRFESFRVEGTMFAARLFFGRKKMGEGSSGLERG